MDQSFENWIKGSTLDAEFGFLYPKYYRPKYFNPEPLTKCLTGLIQKIEAQTFCKEVEIMEDPQLVLEPKEAEIDEQLTKDCFLLHGMINKILESFLLQKSDEKVPTSEIVVPRNIGVPLYKVSNFLKMKYGLTSDFHFNWSLPGYDCTQSLPNDFQVSEVRMMEHFSATKKDEDLFFGGSVIGTHYLFRAIKALYKVNQNIQRVPFESQQQNISLLNEVRGFIRKIVESNCYLLNNISPELFNNDKFRQSFSGFKNLKFEGVEERLSTSGGAGGYDPSFQLFERMMEIEYEGSLKTSQQTFQQGMAEPNRKLLKLCKGKFTIKEYCTNTEELQQAYNNILTEYANFYVIHRELITKFIISKDKNVKAGTAEVNLVDFIQRDKFLTKIISQHPTENNCQKDPQIQHKVPEHQTYDEEYKIKKRIDGFSAHTQWMQNPYDQISNPHGIINFGTSVNSIIPKTTLKYLPTYLTQKDCAYPDPRGCDEEFQSKISEGTNFKWNQTYLFNSLEGVVSLLSFHYKKVAFLGESQTFDPNPILDHSKSTRSHQEQAQLIVVIKASNQKIKEIQKLYEKRMKIYVLSSKEQLNNIEKTNQNQVFTYQFGLKDQLKLWVVQSSDSKIIDLIHTDWTFFHTSNLTKKASLTPGLQIKIGNTTNQVIRQMIKIDSKVQVNQENLWITFGAGGGLNALSRVLFDGGDLCLDSPYYLGFDYDFIHSGIKIIHKSMFSQVRAIDRIKQAYSQGSVGYIICNPNNPVGTKLSHEQVIEICEWAQDKSKFHIIFDEMYLNACRTGSTMSAASYAIRYPNIHVIRGMAKDFGLCGFKIGITISSNPTVIQKLNFWKRIISHHPYTISVINQMLIKSNYGQEIIKYGKELLKQYFDKILKSLDEANIKYIKPEAGCFVFIDLRDYLSESSYEAEDLLWKKLFYKYRVNLNCGGTFHAPEPGYYRICPMTDSLILEQGLRRIKAALSENE